MSLRRLTEHGHKHQDMAAVLQHYGADNVPRGGHGWRKVVCVFHDDNMASAQTDGVGFRCFACDLFYPAPLLLLKDQEGGEWDDAHDLYHRLAGEGDSGGETEGQQQLPGRRVATTRRRGSRRLSR